MCKVYTYSKLSSDDKHCMGRDISKVHGGGGRPPNYQTLPVSSTLIAFKASPHQAYQKADKPAQQGGFVSKTSAGAWFLECLGAQSAWRSPGHRTVTTGLCLTAACSPSDPKSLSPKGSSLLLPSLTPSHPKWGTEWVTMLANFKENMKLEGYSLCNLP